MTARSIPIVLLLLAALSAPPRLAAAYTKPVFMSKWGTFGAAPGQFYDPLGITCDAVGNVYVCDTGNHRIQKFTAGGAFVSQWPEDAYGIASDGSSVFVTTKDNHVRKYTGLGLLASTWGGYGRGDGQFNGAGGIAIGFAGEIFVCDAGNRRIEVLNSLGGYMRQWSTDLNGLVIPIGIATNSINHVYVLCKNPDKLWGGAEVAEYTATGVLVRHWVAGMLGYAIAIDPSDRVMVMDQYLGMAWVYASDGSGVGAFGTSGTGEGQFDWPLGIATHGSTVYVADYTVHRVQRFGSVPTSFYPSLVTKEWSQAGPMVRVHLAYENPSDQLLSLPLSGALFPQPYGGFFPDMAVPVAQVSVPPLPPGMHFDIFADVPFDQLPPTAPMFLAGGGPQPGTCDPARWSGGMDLVWTEGQSSVHSEFQSGEVLVGPGSGYSYLAVMTACAPTDSFTWEFVGNCPGFTATLVEQDRITPAPPHLPPGWHGWVAVTADAAILPGTQCCFGLLLLCDNVPSRVGVCARACSWSTVSVIPGEGSGETRIVGIAPNPARDLTTIRFTLARESRVRLEVLDLAGRSVATLWDGVLSEGAHEQAWDATRARGGPPAAGVYFVRLRAGDELAHSKIFLTR